MTAHDDAAEEYAPRSCILPPAPDGYDDSARDTQPESARITEPGTVDPGLP